MICYWFVLNVSAGHHEHGDHHAKDGKSKEWLIKTLSTAAPSFIGDFASVATYDGKVIKEGINGWTCSPGRPMPK